MRSSIVALLTDFGSRDWYAAAMKGVILSRAPRARLIDITHEIPPQDVMAGAVTLAAAAPWFPPGTVFVAVVDPGVGTKRALLAARADGRYFIGPDNGLLSLVLEQAARRTVVRLTARRYWLPEISRTFHGRDIMAPVAAFLVRGGSLQRLGPPQPRITTLPVPPVVKQGRTIRGAILHVDVFGNLITNLRARTWVPAAEQDRLRLRRPFDSAQGAIPSEVEGRRRHHRVHPAAPGSRTRWRAVLRCRRRRASVVSSYANGRPKQLIAVIGASGLIELAVRNGSAARALRAKRGDRVTLELGR